jgi:hypothetical protein
MIIDQDDSSLPEWQIGTSSLVLSQSAGNSVAARRSRACDLGDGDGHDWKRSKTGDM